MKGLGVNFFETQCSVYYILYYTILYYTVVYYILQATTIVPATAEADNKSIFFILITIFLRF